MKGLVGRGVAVCMHRDRSKVTTIGDGGLEEEWGEGTVSPFFF